MKSPVKRCEEQGDAERERVDAGFGVSLGRAKSRLRRRPLTSTSRVFMTYDFHIGVDYHKAYSHIVVLNSSMNLPVELSR